MKFAQEVPGWPISSDRAELGGVFVGMKLVSMIAEWKGINSKVIIYCNNKAAVDFGKEGKIGKPRPGQTRET